MPLLLAPVGYLRIMHPDGEIAAARAAGKSGVGIILSTVSGYRLEDVKAASTGQVWYQLYLTGGRTAAENALRRAMEAGYNVLVITIDSTVIGYREREVRDGMEQLLDATTIRVDQLSTKGRNSYTLTIGAFGRTVPGMLWGPS